MAKPRPTAAAVGFSSLPEGCIAHILSFTSPQDVCRFASVSSTFRSAADADAIWERFLPLEYGAEISDALSHIFPPFASKKELYLHLCRFPVLIHCGAKVKFHCYSSFSTLISEGTFRFLIVLNSAIKSMQVAY